MAQVIVVVNNSGEALGVFTNEIVMENWAERIGYESFEESSEEEDYVLVPKANSNNVGNLSVSYGVEYLE